MSCVFFVYFSTWGFITLNKHKPGKLLFFFFPFIFAFFEAQLCVLMRQRTREEISSLHALKQVNTPSVCRGPDLLFHLLSVASCRLCALSVLILLSAVECSWILNTCRNYSKPPLFRFPSFILLCDCLIPFLSPPVARSLCLGSALALLSNSICQSALGSRGFAAGRRAASRYYAASQPRRFIAPLKFPTFLVLGRHGANCSAVRFRTNCQICLGTETKGNFSSGYSWDLYVFGIQAEVCVEP